MTRQRSAQPSQRQLRVGEEIRHALARILAEGHLRDPALAGRGVTISEVRVGPNLRSAIAYVIPFAGGEMASLIVALNHAAPYLRGRVVQEVKLRYAPSLRFAADEAFAVAGRIEEILHRPEVQRDLAAEDTESKDDNDAD